MKDYAAYAAANAGVNGWWKKPLFKQEETHPVFKVSWNEAQGFCAWLTKKELVEEKIKAGQKYRLPTDAEWSMAVGLGKEKGNTPEEKAKGSKGVYPWGKEWPPPKGTGNYEGKLKVDKFEYTAPVGSFAANQHGLHDLGGNVWEWCEDKYIPTDDLFRTLRGGAVCKSAPWAMTSDSDLLSACRKPNFPADRLNEARLKMADVPVGGELIENPVSRAPGFRMENVFVMAGVPSIMRAMFDSLAPLLTGGPKVLSQAVATYLPEGTVAEGLGQIQERHPDADIGSYPFYRDGKFGCTLVTRTADEAELAAAADEIRAMIIELGGKPIEQDLISGGDEDEDG